MQPPKLGLDGLGLLGLDAGREKRAGEELGDGQAEELAAGLGRGEEGSVEGGCTRLISHVSN